MNKEQVRQYFMNIKVVLPLLIIVLLFVVIVLPNFGNICIPVRCNFNSEICGKNFCSNETIGQYIAERNQFYIKYQLYNRAESKMFNYLVRAFSDGILNPKIY